MAIHDDDLNGLTAPPVHDCPDCEAAHGVMSLEWEVRTASVDLWVAGWTPDELLHEVELMVGGAAGDFMAHAILVDDALRSEQARPPSWADAVDRLRETVGPIDPAVGWLVRWAQSQPTPLGAAEAAWEVACLLRDLVRPMLAG